MSDKIKDNLQNYNRMVKHKRKHHIDPWRGTGRTTRNLFELASHYPEGNFVYITHNYAMAKHSFRKFIDILSTFGAPITSVNPARMIIKLHGAEYRFAPDSVRLRDDIHTTTTVVEDHMVGELGHNIFRF